MLQFLIGGPRHGHEWLLDSNGAWGQDLVFLKEWVDRHPEARPLHLAAVGWLDPQVLGIDYTIPPVGPLRPVTNDDRRLMADSSHHRVPFGWRERNGPVSTGRNANGEQNDSNVPQSWQDVRSLDDLGPQPGWHVIDVNFLHGTGWSGNWPGWRFQKIAEDGLNYEYFRLFRPFDRVAYSYVVYHITRDEADRIRRHLGLPPLAASRLTARSLFDADL